MVVSPSGSVAVRPKRNSRGKKDARVTSVETPMAVRNGKALEWVECGDCLGCTRCLRNDGKRRKRRLRGCCKGLIKSISKKQGHGGPVAVLLRTLAQR
jgi:hypothetical protein